MLRHLSFWVHAKAAAKTKGGRLAYRRIYQHIFGVNALAIRDAACDSKIRALKYTGDHKNFNWYRYTNLHVEQHNVNSSIITHGFTDFTDAQKACYLIDGIKTANLETCIETITTNDALREDLAALIFTLWISLSDRRPETPIATSPVSILAEVEAGARSDEEETAEAEVLKVVEVRVPLTDHASVSPLRLMLTSALTLPGVITLALLMLSLILLSDRKSNRTRRNMDATMDATVLTSPATGLIAQCLSCLIYGS